MKATRKILLTIITVSLLTGCDFIKNTFTYKDKTKAFMETILNEDYDKTLDHFAMEHEMAKDMDIEMFKSKLPQFRKSIIDNFGAELDYSFMSSEKTVSTSEEENTPPNTTDVYIQISNGQEYGVLKILFDDVSGKILNINTLDVKKPIPSMTVFWLFGLLAISIPVFNVYVIRKIKRSNLNRKWLKYIAVIFLNIPSLTYAAMGGFTFKLLSLQVLLGFSFSYMGYSSAFWTFGIPLGGLYWFLQLRNQSPEVNEPELPINTTTEINPVVTDSPPETQIP